MRTLVLAAALGVASVAFVAVPSAAAAGPAWQLSLRTHCSTDCAVEDVAAVGPDDAWAVGGGGTARVRHWDGHAWQSFPVGDLQYPETVAAVSSDDVWFGGWEFRDEHTHPLTLHWDGSRLSVVTTPDGSGTTGGGADVHTIAASSDGGVWAAGDWYGSGGQGTRTWRWTGTRWQVVPFDAVLQEGVVTVAAAGRDDAWLLGQYANDDPYTPVRFTVWHWTGSAWKALPDGNPAGHVSARDMVVRSGKVWVGGGVTCQQGTTGCHAGGFLRKWTGSAWTSLEQPAGTLAALAGDGGLRTALATDGATPRFAHWNGSVWTTGSGPALSGRAQTVSLAHVPGTRDTWAAGHTDDPDSNATGHVLFRTD